MYDRRINSVNLSAWKDRLAAGKYDAPLAALYGAADAPRSRYARLCEEYLRTFGDAPDALLISAPGQRKGFYPFPIHIVSILSRLFWPWGFFGLSDLISW